MGRALGEEVKYAVIRLPTDFMKRLYPSLPLVETMSSFQGFRDPFCYWVTQELISTIESDADADREMLTESALRSLSLHVYRNYGCKPNQSNSSLHLHSDTIRANALQEYVRSNLDRRIPVLELQAIAGATTEVFLDSFRKAFGTTPAQYVIEQRIRRAQWLLTHTETPITEIAFETGFSSHGHFSRSFKKRIGKSPRLYRDHQTVMAKKNLLRTPAIDRQTKASPARMLLDSHHQHGGAIVWDNDVRIDGKIYPTSYFLNARTITDFTNTLSY